ncbi:hypothetical protein E4U60_005665 [Claviceps pazoutovae]|uniref:Tyrosine specific protein phosphatases domain-containing protein n=1 Tax=Claviceps pazoutovae TaxID=1649127 RepID=A0A9P7M7P4_9HYPO|nr:hypothetical protein E4U60_005665 [Claviceps pazoutovae]
MSHVAPHRLVLPNLRDLGNVPIPPSHPASSPSSSRLQTRAGLLYRAAAPSTSAVPSLLALSIAHVFDLRSEVEIDRQGGHFLAEIYTSAPPALLRHHVPVFLLIDYTPQAVAIRYLDYGAADTIAGFVSAYRGILRAGAERAFAPILRHLAQENPSPCLVYCTAGKDSTGLLAAIVLALCGVDDETIAWEYGLSEEGLAPLKPAMIMELLATQSAVADESGAIRMLSSRPESMLATLQIIREEYGGVEEYVRTHCKLSQDDIEQIRTNFIVEVPPSPTEDGDGAGVPYLNGNGGDSKHEVNGNGDSDNDDEGDSDGNSVAVTSRPSSES